MLSFVFDAKASASHCPVITELLDFQFVHIICGATV
jgi:hypothetical protein